MSLTGLASGVGSGAKNVAFAPVAEVLPSKIIITGQQLSSKSLPLEPFLSLSPENTGDKTGFGSMAHRLHLKCFLGSQGVETWILPQDEAGGAAASAGEIDWTGSTGVLAGQLVVYISGDPYPVAITAAMTVENISDAVIAVINAVNETPVIATKTAVTFETVLTAKSLSAEGDSIDISLDIGPADVTPTGIVSAITAMTGGSGVPTMATALAALGENDDANEAEFTHLIHGYGQDTTTLDAILAYVGAGNDFNGLYSKTVARPFDTHEGDVVADDAGLAAQIVISDLRLEDRSQGPVCVPGSQSDPNEIAAQAIGHRARKSNKSATASWNGVILIGVQPGAKADRWTSDRDNRNIAVAAGISPTRVIGGNVVLQNLVSYYRPASVPVSSNGYREMRNISVTKNILASQKTFFSREKWQDFDIVQDVTKVTNATAKARSRDINSVLDDLILLINEWAGISWLYNSSFSIDRLIADQAKANPELITVRTNSDGFNITIPVLYSGIGNILDVTENFDISFAVLNGGS